MRSVNIGAGGILDLTGAKLKLVGESFVNNGFITSTEDTSGLVFAGPNAVYSGSGTAFVRAVQLLGTTFTLDSVNNIRTRRIQLYSGDIIHANKFTLGNNDATVTTSPSESGTCRGTPGTFDAARFSNWALGGPTFL